MENHTGSKGFTRHFVEMSDEAFLYVQYYRSESPEASPSDAFVMIPGFCCTSASFDKNAPVLAETADVIVYDPRGQGSSSKGLQGHTVSRNAQDLKEILAYFGKTRAVVIAWSMAGQFIMDYVRQFGCEDLAGIVLADCPLHALGNEEWNAHGLRDGNMGHFLAHLGRSYNEWEDYCRGFARKIWEGIDDSRIEWATGEFLKTPPWIAFAIYSDMVYRNGFPYLAKAEVPMLFTGADSKVTENERALAGSWYPESRPAPLISESCLFEHGGHVFFDVESEKFNRAVAEFYRGLVVSD